MASLAAWGGGSTRRNDHVNLEPNQLGRDGGESFGSPLRISALDDDVLALDVPEFPQPLQEPVPETRDLRGGRRESPENADSKHLRRLLRLDGERRREEGEEGGEREPSHWAPNSTASWASEYSKTSPRGMQPGARPPNT